MQERREQVRTTCFEQQNIPRVRLHGHLADLARGGCCIIDPCRRAAPEATGASWSPHDWKGGLAPKCDVSTRITSVRLVFRALLPRPVAAVTAPAIPAGAGRIHEPRGSPGGAPGRRAGRNVMLRHGVWIHVAPSSPENSQKVAF